MLKRHRDLVHSDGLKVTSHVQREKGEWIVNTLVIEGCDAPFKYKRKQRYRSIAGQRVNLTYYPVSESIGGIDFETMRVVRIRVS